MVIYRDMNILERIYHAGLSWQQRRNLADRKRLPCRVISIGNITVGGTGKTPATMALAQEALKRSLAPVILTRGYRGTARGPCFVTTGSGPLLSAGEAGDEPYLMARRLSGIPIVKGPDRYKSGIFALDRIRLQDQAAGSETLFLLDDGFQHSRLFRDMDIVLLDAEDPFGGNRLLPFGRLREPLAALERADIIVVTKSGIKMDGRGPAIEKTLNSVREYNTKAGLYIADHLPVSATDRCGREQPLRILAGKKIFGFCGIGSPGSFLKTLKDTGAEVAGFRPFRDHHRYTPADIAGLAKEAGELKCEWIVTTEKDIIKIEHLDLPENILIIRIEFSIDSSFYDRVFEQRCSISPGREYR
ncbi:MAG: tetraacyldisaccharide 4'-kinase [Thermodesulfovibrio sp.]|nr:tetraacyldisaccharide 4'-kinase [Thermodesulfovibrio sp.]